MDLIKTQLLESVFAEARYERKNARSTGLQRLSILEQWPRFTAFEGRSQCQNGARPQGFASPRCRAPLPSVRRSGDSILATGSSGGNTTACSPSLKS
jgi:hypothetical protein